jgi:hypothetical protein
MLHPFLPKLDICQDRMSPDAVQQVLDGSGGAVGGHVIGAGFLITTWATPTCPGFDRLGLSLGSKFR